MSLRDEVIDLIALAEDQGFIVIRRRKGHYKWIAPDGAIFFSASTPSDWRALKNIKRDLRNHGFKDVEGR